MTTETLAPAARSDPRHTLESRLDAAIAGAAEDGGGPEAAQRQLVIINWSGQYDKVMPTLIMSSVAAASGYRAKVFLTFWGLLPFVRDDRRITGQNWMQKMLSAMQRPGISHLKMSQMNFLGMGPWMIGKLSKQYNVASPKELLEACQLLGVEFLPCQMTMDMFGLKPEDMIDGMGDPVGAATVLELMTEDRTAALFI
jgi:peroxiredoxin family protein